MAWSAGMLLSKKPEVQKSIYFMIPLCKEEVRVKISLYFARRITGVVNKN